MKQSFWISLFAVSTLGLWSCSQDDLSKPGGETTSPDVMVADGFIGFQIKNTEVKSRATHNEYDDTYQNQEWFNKGTEEERAIIDNPESNRVLFFNSDFSFYGSGLVEKPASANAASNIYVAKKPANTEGLPQYALLVLNGDPDRLNALEIELNTAGTDALMGALNYINESSADSYESIAQYSGYFTMTSASYVDVDNVMSTAVVAPESGFTFYDTVEEAIMPTNLTVFYVERLLAKLTLIINKDLVAGQLNNVTFGEMEGGKIAPMIVAGAYPITISTEYQPAEGQTGAHSSDWSINLINWGVNATESNTYLFKSLEENQTGTYPLAISADYYKGWNSPILYRSFWGTDENYSSGVYPEQYRVALDIDGIDSATGNTIYSDDYSASEGLKKKDYTLNYRSYNSYIKSATSTRSDNKYTVENTFDVKAPFYASQDINSKPYLRCGTHIILAAQLIIDELDGDVDLTAADEMGYIKGITDKYFSNGQYWGEKALLQQAVATLLSNSYYYETEAEGNKVKDILNSGKTVDYINNTPDTNPLDAQTPILANDGTPITIDNADKYFEFVPAFIKGGDGWVTIGLKDGVSLKAKYSDGTTKNLTKNQVVSYIYRFTNLAKHFAEGRMYYAIPVKHNLESPAFISGMGGTATGDFGVVRNHWYRLTINSILTPGTPIDDPDQPLIPNNEPDDKSLGLEVEVLPWEPVEIDVPQLQ